MDISLYILLLVMIIILIHIYLTKKYTEEMRIQIEQIKNDIARIDRNTIKIANILIENKLIKV